MPLNLKNIPIVSGVEVFIPSSELFEANILETLKSLLCKNYLLLLRNQSLDEESFIRLAEIFGEPIPSLMPLHRLEHYPVISKFTNVKGQNGATSPEYVFHSDGYFTPNPNKITLLYSLKSPTSGGETCFINMCSVYQALDNSMKEFLQDKQVDYKNVYINQPPVKHPCIRIEPINKYKALGIEGIETNEALNIINKLYEFSTQDQFIYKHFWRDGDVAIWYNPTTMHCATPISDSETRLLYRILTKGDLPVI